MPAVKLELQSRPESLILVRGMLVGVADLLGFDPELVHNLKTVVSEACNNVIIHAYGGEPGPLAVSLEIAPDGVEAVVRDWGRGIRHVTPAGDRFHVGLAVISAIADRAQFLRAPGGGTEVRMAFTGQGGIRTLDPPVVIENGDQVAMELSGDAIATLSPVGLLEGVLARVTTALAAHARFSLDRFCDVYLVTDAVAAHAGSSAVGDQLGFAVAAGDHSLELTVGPFRVGSGVELRDEDGFGQLGSALSLLAVELEVEPVVGAEMWRLVVHDSGDRAAVSA
ncbi:MAG TPA: ATP-binding protein [Solirubrobacteraceae bacterium]|nr:ATP-binding protein [Solirubrobacteraceae bacterium]